MTGHDVALLFVDLAIIVVLTRGLGVLAGKLGQPAVIGELLAGVFILPFAIHRFAGGLFPAEVRTSLSAVAAVGVALFMFLVGMDLERELIRGRTPIAVSVAVTATASSATDTTVETVRASRRQNGTTGSAARRRAAGAARYPARATAAETRSGSTAPSIRRCWTRFCRPSKRINRGARKNARSPTSIGGSRR